MKRNFIVTLEIPEGCTVEDVCEYIEESIRVHKGGKDPIFDLDGKSVKVRPASKPEK